MNFSEKHSEDIYGVLEGFDRMVFSGQIRTFHSPKAIYYYLSRQDKRLVDFEKFMKSETAELRAHLEGMASDAGVPVHYINNSYQSKDEIARRDLEAHPTGKGLISVISTKETGMSFSLRKNKKTGELEARWELRKHLHYYLYMVDPEFGWMYIKIQSWLPFKILIYINGRVWLMNALEREGIGYEASGNGISWVEDLERAQEISNRLMKRKWERVLKMFAKRVNPLLEKMNAIFNRKGYSWYCHQMEYATDVLYKSRDKLESLYPSLVGKATLFNGGDDIYTFFAKKLHGNCTKEVTGSTKRFSQGFRVKHYLDRNSIKMYDKGSILRVETTINNPRAFKAYKDVFRKGKPCKAWVPVGKAVSNLYRLAEIGRAANKRYLNTLACVDRPDDKGRDIEDVSKSTVVAKPGKQDRRIPALNLLSEATRHVLEAISDVQFCLRSFSNRDIRELLIEKKWCEAPDDNAIKKLSGKITRLLGKLMGHKMIRRVRGTFKYYLTKKGKNICCSILLFKNPTVCAV